METWRDTRRKHPIDRWEREMIEMPDIKESYPRHIKALVWVGVFLFGLMVWMLVLDFALWVVVR